MGKYMPYYVIQVFSGKEEETIKRIYNEIDKIDDSIDFFVPKRKRLIKKEGVSRELIETMFPGYIFIESDKNNIVDLKKKLYKVKTLTKLLGIDKDNKDYVASLSIEEEEFINLLLGKDNPSRTVELSHIYLTEGKEVVVIDGPLKGLEGKISKVNLHKRRVTVDIEFMGTITQAELGIDIVEEIEKK